MSRFKFCNCPAGFSAPPERHAPDCPGRSGAGKARTPIPKVIGMSAAPQPPALGGEPEERTRRTSEIRDEAYDNGWNECRDAYRDHLAPLQAEIERLTKYAEAEAKGADSVAEDLLKWTSDNRKLRKGRGQLKARCDELEGLLREVVALDPHGEFMGWQLEGRIDAALSKPAGSEQ